MDKNLKDIWKGRVVMVGIGNPLRGDDAFGPELIARLKGKISAACIDAGSAPESYTGKIIKENPDTIILADVAHLDLPPGDYQILQKEEILKSGLTTHDLSPRMFVEYLESQTKAKICMLGVQPKTVSMGEEMSGEIKDFLNKMTKMIQEIDDARNTLN
ncbi:MAG: hydrogenase 3 maturation endopeptidase HyCI [Candidatus Omnitrophota bacterium]